MQFLLAASPLAAILSVLPLSPGLSAQQGQRRVAVEPPAVVEVGSRPEYSFKQRLLNGRGIGSLADLQGKPTLIEFWGTR